jgi:hypothetical protein
MQLAFMAQLSFCARAGEIAALKVHSDKGKNTGMYLSAHTATYEVNLDNEIEVAAAERVLLRRTRKTPQLEEIAQIQEPVAIFTVRTEKRTEWKRECALPLNWEPYAKPLLTHIQHQTKHGKPAFPITRHNMIRAAHIVFKGMIQTIYPYKRTLRDENGQIKWKLNTDGNIQKTEYGRPIPETKTMPESTRFFGTHGLRKVRENQLKSQFGFSGEERAIFGGWTKQTKEAGVSRSQERYEEDAWRTYFIKLCRKTA